MALENTKMTNSPNKFTIVNPIIEEGKLFRLVKGNVEISVMPVMFGYRVRGGILGELYFNLDWCAGDDLRFIGVLLEAMESLLEVHGLNDLPSTSAYKPAFLDLPFMARLVQLGAKAGHKHYAGHLKEIKELKCQYMKHALG